MKKMPMNKQERIEQEEQCKKAYEKYQAIHEKLWGPSPDVTGVDHYCDDNGPPTDDEIAECHIKNFVCKRTYKRR